MRSPRIRLHAFEPVSQVNGPGKRAVIWVQGCGLACPGCFNPETHDFSGGSLISVDDLLSMIIQGKEEIEGITVSGGEPAYQRRALTRLFQEIRCQTNLSIVVFSGYTLDELNRTISARSFLESIDVLIAGRYDQNLRVADGLTGSANKTFTFFTSRYTPQDFTQIPQAEVTISPQGEITFSGIYPLEWK